MISNHAPQKTIPTWHKLPELFELLENFKQLKSSQRNIFTTCQKMITQSRLWQARQKPASAASTTSVSSMTEDEKIQETIILEHCLSYLNLNNIATDALENHPAIAWLSQTFTQVCEDLSHLDPSSLSRHYATNPEFDSMTYAKILMGAALKQTESDQFLKSLLSITAPDKTSAQTTESTVLPREQMLSELLSFSDATTKKIKKLACLFPYLDQDMQINSLRQVMLLWTRVKNASRLRDFMADISAHLNSVTLSAFLNMILPVLKDKPLTDFYEVFQAIAQHAGAEEKKQLLKWMPNLHPSELSLDECIPLGLIYAFLDELPEEKAQVLSIQSIIQTLVLNPVPDRSSDYLLGIQGALFSKGIMLHASDLQKEEIINHFFNVLSSLYGPRYSLPVTPAADNQWLLTDIASFYPLLSSELQNEVITRLSNIILNHANRTASRLCLDRFSINASAYAAIQLALLAPLIGKDQATIEQCLWEKTNYNKGSVLLKKINISMVRTTLLSANGHEEKADTITSNDPEKETPIYPLSLAGMFCFIRDIQYYHTRDIPQNLPAQIFQAMLNVLPFLSSSELKKIAPPNTCFGHEAIKRFYHYAADSSTDIPAWEEDRLLQHYLRQIPSTMDQESVIHSIYKETWSNYKKMKRALSGYPKSNEAYWIESDFYQYRADIFYLAILIHNAACSTPKSLSERTKEIACKLIDRLFREGNHRHLQHHWHNLKTQLGTLAYLYPLASLPQQQQIKEKFLDTICSSHLTDISLLQTTVKAFEILVPQLNFYEKQKMLNSLEARIKKDSGAQKHHLQPFACLFAPTYRMRLQAEIQPAIDACYINHGKPADFPPDVTSIIKSYI